MRHPTMVDFRLPSGAPAWSVLYRVTRDITDPSNVNHGHTSPQQLGLFLTPTRRFYRSIDIKV